MATVFSCVPVKGAPRRHGRGRNPAPALSAVYGPVTGTADDLPLPDRPLLPLALALPRMLQEIEAALATAGPAEARRLRERARLILDLRSPEEQSPIPS
jgi:hypothetical protein